MASDTQRAARDRAALAAKGIKPMSFEPQALPCPGHEDSRCMAGLCRDCRHFSTAVTLGAVRQAPARSLDLLGKTWVCVDFEAAAHGDANVDQQVKTRKSAVLGGGCPTSSADEGLAP